MKLKDIVGKTVERVGYDGLTLSLFFSDKTAIAVDGDCGTGLEFSELVEKVVAETKYEKRNFSG